jgi:hypothetical protein
MPNVVEFWGLLQVDVSRPHPRDPATVSRPKRSNRRRNKSVKILGPEWACVACEEKPAAE